MVIVVKEAAAMGVNISIVPGELPLGEIVEVKAPVIVPLAVYGIVVVTYVAGKILVDTGLNTSTVPGNVPMGETVDEKMPVFVPLAVYGTVIVV